ncbi:MAG: hypothetical protein KAS95_09635, partial [Candidatus Heimdallarchaeota archaeon]|nr:hypothetical protein [Candidatus Heimdallarchaeota archaeon]
FNINVIELPDYLESPSMTSQVNFTLIITGYADTDNDTLNDTISFHVNNDAFSLDIYIYDFDIMLPTGELVDETIPWVIVPNENNFWWNEYLGQQVEGYMVGNGTSAYFDVQCESLEGSIGELGFGESFYVIMNYRYLLQAGGRFAIENSFYQSSLITIT